MTNSTGLFIGELARRAGIPISTIRYYQRNGLIDDPPRRESGYREYPDGAIDQLRFIRSAQELGFTLQQIRSLIALRDAPEATSAEVRELADSTIADIRAKLVVLTAMEQSLSRLLSCCNGDSSVDACPIIIELETTTGGNHESKSRSVHSRMRRV